MIVLQKVICYLFKPIVTFVKPLSIQDSLVFNVHYEEY